jgi:RNA-binding protein
MGSRILGGEETIRTGPLGHGGSAIRALTSRQRAYLRSLAHPLRPVVQVGADGAGEPVLRAIDDAFQTRELLKVRLLENAPEGARQTADRLAGALDRTGVVQVIGRTIVLYRPFPEEPGIQLPG